MNQFLLLAAVSFLPSLSWIGGGKLGSYLANVRGNRAYERKQYTEAMKHYRAAQRQDPTGGVPPCNLGAVLYRQRKYDKAIQSFEKALNSDDAFLQAQAYYDIGNCYFRSDDLVKAIDSYKKSLQINPKDVDAKFNLEMARRKLKETAKKQPQKQNTQQQQMSTANQMQAQKSSQKEKTKKQNQHKPPASEAQKSKSGEPQKDREAQRKKPPMSQEDARRLLQALVQQEKDARRKAQRQQMQIPGEFQVEKDW